MLVLDGVPRWDVADNILSDVVLIEGHLLGTHIVGGHHFRSLVVSVTFGVDRRSTVGRFHLVVFLVSRQFTSLCLQSTSLHLRRQPSTVEQFLAAFLVSRRFTSLHLRRRPSTVDQFFELLDIASVVFFVAVLILLRIFLHEF